MVCGAKRIRSLYLPWMTGVTPKLSTTAPLKALASLSTINAATMRFAEQTSLPRTIAAGLSRAFHGKAAPTAFSLTEPTARRGRRPYPQPQQVVRA